MTKDGTSASRLTKETSVDCMQKADGTCLSKVEMPISYKMVQFGTASVNNVAGTMFNMSTLPDTDDFIVNRYKMSDKWDNHETLRFRHITMRLYKSSVTGEHMLCAIFHTYGLPSDGLGSMSVSSTVKGVDGQMLQWAACDDKRECSGGPGGELRAQHALSFTHSDGWCVKPLEEDSGAISVKFSDVQGFEGISFQLSDGNEDAYYFMDGTDGMTGAVDGNALVKDGDVPEILFDLAGIQVPQ